ncbi:PREDICTED: amino acid transporter ANTL1-like [Priapulus caudatus]|uniref:Amino acid transporter ANTL1-like n=1 Tax=Priapulus caudatus TaxID=37621 RepID=A0ABM1EU20_PRICU|nr:PREDICTED: amino acid transporter ANTL1-like [Priapulus caudatus]
MRHHHSTRSLSHWGVFAWSFTGHPIFPRTSQNDMAEPNKFKYSIVLAFAVVRLLEAVNVDEFQDHIAYQQSNAQTYKLFVILLMYMPVATISYLAYGSDLVDNVLLNLPPGVVRSVAQILITVHLLSAFVIVVNPLCQEVEELMKIPKHFNPFRCLMRTLIMLLVLLLAESVPHFGSILSLVGSSTLMLLTFILPCIFYERLVTMTSSDWETRYIPLHIRAINYEVIGLGAIAMIMGTYSAMSYMVGAHTFTVPCYFNVTAASG